MLKCEWNQSFGSLLEQLDGLEETIEKIEISKNESFVDPVHVVPVDAPVSLCKQFDCSFVCIHIAQRDSVPSDEASMPNALLRLMESSCRLVLPETIPTPDGGRALRGDQRLHNDLLGKFLSLSLSLSLFLSRTRTHTHTHIVNYLSPL